MKKYIFVAYFTLLTYCGTFYSTESEIQIIKGASYLVYEGAENAIIGRTPPMKSCNVSFYSFDGELLATMPRKFTFMECMLDASAPKPQPTNFKIAYWDGEPIQPESFKNDPILWIASKFGMHMRKGVPGNFIVFCDKNGNIIGSERCEWFPNNPVGLPKIDSKLDLSLIKAALDKVN
jgi:hypothetical protein